MASKDPLESKKTLRHFGQHHELGQRFGENRKPASEENLKLDTDSNPCSAT